jgi:hypothetical protein
MDSKGLRTFLLGVLSDDLGVYTNNQVSIWVYGADSNPPSSSNGLECLIMKQPLSPSQSMSGGIKYKPQLWQIVLKNYATSNKLVRAISKIETRLVVKNYRYMPATNDIIEQANLSVFNPIVY